MGDLPSISSTLNVRVFCTNVISAQLFLRMYVKISCRNDIGTKKRARLTLMKLTPLVDFTNVFARIFRARLSYERLFSSYVLRKTRAKSVGEINPWSLDEHKVLREKRKNHFEKKIESVSRVWAS